MRCDCVWGSDWPHTPPHEEQKGPGVLGRYRARSYDRLVDDFLAALSSDARADRILRDNPARLYEFSPSRGDILGRQGDLEFEESRLGRKPCLVGLAAR